MLGGGDSTKVPRADPSRWELICSKFCDVFGKPNTPPERAIEHEIAMLPGSIPPANR